MSKGTVTMLNLTALGPGVSSSYGYCGLTNAKRVSIYFSGSYAGAIGTTPMLSIYGAIAQSTGSVEATAIGTIVLAIGAAASVKRRFATITNLEAYPLIAVKAQHRMATGTLGPVVAKAIVGLD